MKGHAVGATESITPVKGANGISFTVDNLSPFAIGWYKTAASAGGGGGGGGAAAATTYVLTFETNGGSAMEKVTKDSGTTVELASYKPTRTGYTFDGWFSDKELMKPVTSVKLTADTTVYAKWTQNGEIKNPFIDVKSGDYFYDAVLWAVERYFPVARSRLAQGGKRQQSVYRCEAEFVLLRCGPVGRQERRDERHFRNDVPPG